MIRAVIKSLTLIVFITSVVYAQTLTEEQRRQLERELRLATPQEIQERLRQAGISQEEAIRRARAEGLSLEEILFPEREISLEEPERLRRVSPSHDLESLTAERLAHLGLSREVAQQRAAAEGETLTEFLFPDKPLHRIDEETRSRLRLYGLSRNDALMRARTLGLMLEEFVFPGPIDATLVRPSILEKDIPLRDFRPKEFAGRETAQNLDAFGYRIFDYPVTTFEPVLSIPPPANYRLGAGDELVISVWGEVQLHYSLTINREGFIIIPDVGQVMSAGLTLQQMRERLLRRMSQVYSSLIEGADARSYLDVSIGKLRTIQVFVLGDVNRPGGYTMSSMSTSFKALYFAGGPTLEGSMRDIRIVRQGKEIIRIDLYQYILKGDQSGDIRLEDGDIVFVPTVGRRVALVGRVARPAVYEINEDELLGDLIRMAGGLQFDADINRIHIERIIPFAQRRDFKYNVLDIDIRFEDENEILNSDYLIEAGDIVTIFSLPQRLENRVRVVGNVFKPGVYELSPGMTVRDLILRADGLLDDTFMDRSTLIRTREETMMKEIIRIDLHKAMEGNDEHNYMLKRLDELHIYSREYLFPQFTVTISGEVRNPGTYTRANEMTVDDLIVLAGGTTEEAMLDYVTVSRIDTLSARRYTETFRVPLPNNYWEVPSSGSFKLIDFDHVEVPPDPRRSKQRFINITGEILYPGKYAIEHDEEKILSIIERAGGLRETAYVSGARYFRSVDGVNRLVPISLENAIRNPTSLDNIVIKDGDELHIPSDPGVVVVRGAVNVPAAVAYEHGKSLRYYITQAGGYAENADKRRTTATLPNGRAWKSSGWFFIPNEEILSGSIINVPEKAPREGRSMEILRDWSMLMVSTAAIVVSIVQITR